MVTYVKRVVNYVKVRRKGVLEDPRDCSLGSLDLWLVWPLASEDLIYRSC